MITEEKGKKHAEDRVIFVNGKKITFKEWAEVFLKFCRNEDKIYPMPKFVGRNMLLNFLYEVLRDDKVSNQLLKKYKLDIYS